MGDKYADGTYYIPDMLAGAMAMQAGMAEIKSLLAKADVTTAGTVVAFAVEGDVHDIGKNLVCMVSRLGLHLVRQVPFARRITISKRHELSRSDGSNASSIALAL